MPDPGLGQPLVDIGGWLVVVGTVVVAMVRGWLVPGRQVDRLVDDKDRQIANLWEAWRTEAKRGEILAENQEKALEMLRALSSQGSRS